MKKTILINTLAIAGLAILPVSAEHHGEKPAVDPAAEQVAAVTVPAYIVQTSGKG
ncbi:hypothetical protein OAI07_00595 [Akkermansiaceae bacterium]|nr:hypothetical protein [Akkermansiaceae bacterium]